jgi:hypothetical protein
MADEIWESIIKFFILVTTAGTVVIVSVNKVLKNSETKAGLPELIKRIESAEAKTKDLGDKYEALLLKLADWLSRD